MQVINAILPVLLISILGYCLARFRFLSSEGTTALSKLTFTILIPCLLFLGVTRAKLGNVFYIEFLAAYFIPVLIVFILGTIISKLIFGFNAKNQSVFALGGAYSNATVIGIPICLYTLGEPSLVPLSIIVTFHNFILFTIGTLSAERGGMSFASVFEQLAKILRSFITNPITMSLMAGVLVNIFSVPIHPILLSSFDFLGEAAVPIAFLVLGTSLSGYGLKGQLLPMLFIVPTKLLLLPLLVWYFTFNVFAIELLWAKTAVVIAAAPVGIATYVFTQRYHAGESYLASSILISTVLSIFSFSFWIEWLG